jgi:hypothetical protein
VEKQREKLYRGITGKGFVKNDPRINRRDRLARYEAQAIETIGRALQSSKPWVRLRGRAGGAGPAARQTHAATRGSPAGGRERPDDHGAAAA